MTVIEYSTPRPRVLGCVRIELTPEEAVELYAALGSTSHCYDLYKALQPWADEKGVR